ncbi:unnamed protein product [Blepharisma stoltei]|uniref:Transmembrane protein n=1 Tax=Blepharisma stoltei TaxID=1481888 RepID=A0AAU9J5J0_9CILI|nr:unnamed protein product [Blepharisma stoltei]
MKMPLILIITFFIFSVNAKDSIQKPMDPQESNHPQPEIKPLQYSEKISKEPNKKPLMISFLQISNDNSGQDNDGLDDKKKVYMVFIFNFVACIACFALLQGILIFSKKMNSKLTSLRANYKNFVALSQFKDFQRQFWKPSPGSQAQRPN